MKDTPLVFGVGPKDAKVVIVGEAPGRDEIRRGEPFVGKSGKMLNELLARAGIPRSHCYITNVVKERPPKNDISTFFDFKRKEVLLTEKARYYIDLLKEELSELNPNVIVAVGRTPLWALTNNQGIQKWRGSILDNVLVPNTKTIPILHPAAALRQYIWTHFIRQDLMRVAEESESPDFPAWDEKYILRPTFKEVMEYLNLCADVDLCGFDIEVAAKQVSCISFAPSPKSAISIPFLEGTNHYFPSHQETAIWQKIGEILESGQASIGHNVTFDSTFLFRRYGIKARNLHDTMVAQNILFPDFPRSLAFLTSIYTKIPYYKDEGKEQMKGGSGDVFWEYNAKDSIVLMQTFPQQLQELQQMGNYEAYEDQRRLINPLLFLTRKGIKMNVDKLNAMSSKAQDRMDEVLLEIRALTGYEINPNSPKQLKDYFYNVKGHRPYKNKGRPTTNETALKRLARKRDEETAEVARLVMEYRSLRKADSTYYNVSLDEDHRLRSSMNPAGTTSGRLSSSKTIFGTGANMQNQTPDMKKSMIPDPNMVAFSIDLAQAENRVVAYYAPDIEMIEAFEHNDDLHKKTAGLVFGVPASEVTYDEDDPTHWVDLGSGDHAMRYWGKRANHGLNYGMSYRRAGLLWEIPEKQAKFIVDRYHQAYPGVEKMHRKIQSQLNKNRILINPLGRKRLFLDRWGRELFKEAYSWVPQSTVAGKINRDGVCYIYYNQQIFEHVHLMNQVHDSVEFQIPLTIGWEEIARLILIIKEKLEEPLVWENREFSIPADVEIHPINLWDGHEFSGTNWDPTWSEPDTFGQALADVYNQAVGIDV